MNRSRRRGFIKIILVIIIAVLALSYFGISLRDITESKVGQDNLSFLKDIGTNIWEFCQDVWRDYLREPVMSVWDFIMAGIAKIKGD